MINIFSQKECHALETEKGDLVCGSRATLYTADKSMEAFELLSCRHLQGLKACLRTANFCLKGGSSVVCPFCVCHSSDPVLLRSSNLGNWVHQVQNPRKGKKREFSSPWLFYLIRSRVCWTSKKSALAQWGNFFLPSVALGKYNS